MHTMSNDSYEFLNFRVDRNAAELRHGDDPVPLEPKAFDLLCYLIEHRNRTVSKDELLKNIWSGVVVSETALTSCVRKIRRALDDPADTQTIIKTVPRRGYRFVAQSTAPETAAVVESRSVPNMKDIEQTIRLCSSDDGVRLAYATSGEGPHLVQPARYLTHLEHDWLVWRHWLNELSAGHTLVRYDARGSGLSDRNVSDFSMGALLHDLETVVDAMELEQFALLGISQGASVGIAYAAKHPERVSHLVLYGGYARGRFNRDLSAVEMLEAETMINAIRVGWGQQNPAFRQLFSTLIMPDASPLQAQQLNELARVSAAPETAAQMERAFYEIDVTDLARRVTVPTLILHSRLDATIPFEESRLLAALIPEARLVPLESRNHIILEDEPAWRRFVDEVLQFLGQPLPN